MILFICGFVGFALSGSLVASGIRMGNGFVVGSSAFAMIISVVLAVVGIMRWVSGS